VVALAVEELKQTATRRRACAAAGSGADRQEWAGSSSRAARGQCSVATGRIAQAGLCWEGAGKGPRLRLASYLAPRLRLCCAVSQALPGERPGVRDDRHGAGCVQDEVLRHAAATSHGAQRAAGKRGGSRGWVGGWVGELVGR
jgi:hypothetical protein